MKAFATLYGPRILLVVAVAVFFMIWEPTFRGEASVFAVLEFLPLLGLVSLGVTVPLLAGEFDLSVGSTAALAAVVAVHVASAGLVVSIVTGMIVGLVVGAVQGLLISRLPVSSLAFTLGSLIVLRGLAYVLADNQPLPLADIFMTDPLFERYLGVFTIGSIIALAMFVAIGLLLAYSRPGRQLYAIGGGRHEAIAIGISLEKSLILAFSLSGLCAGLAGTLASLKGGTADPGAFADYLLLGIAAALIGGIALTGGRGSALNVLLGALLLATISAGMNFHGASPAVTAIVTGLLLLVVVAFGVIASLIKSRRDIAKMRSAKQDRPTTAAGSVRA